MIQISPSEPYEIKKELGDFGIPSPLLPADYAWYSRGLKSLVERKHIPGDLLASMADGRLTREVQALLANIETGGRSYLLLEGALRCDERNYVLNPDRPSGWHISQVSAQLATIQLMGVELILSPSIKQTALLLASQMRWEMKEDHSSLRVRPGPGGDGWRARPSYSNYMIWSFQGIPKVGADIAEVLFEAAGTWEGLVAMSVEDLMQLKHFGKVRAERVWKFLHEGVVG